MTKTSDLENVRHTCACQEVRRSPGCEVRRAAIAEENVGVFHSLHRVPLKSDGYGIFCISPSSGPLTDPHQQKFLKKKVSVILLYFTPAGAGQFEFNMATLGDLMRRPVRSVVCWWWRQTLSRMSCVGLSDQTLLLVSVSDLIVVVIRCWLTMQVEPARREYDLDRNHPQTIGRFDQPGVSAGMGSWFLFLVQGHKKTTNNYPVVNEPEHAHESCE